MDWTPRSEDDGGKCLWGSGLEGAGILEEGVNGGGRGSLQLLSGCSRPVSWKTAQSPNFPAGHARREQALATSAAPEPTPGG